MMRSMLLACGVLLGGCAGHEVRCDAHLEPINPPAPRVAPADRRPAVAPGIVPAMPGSDEPQGNAP